MGFYEKAIGLGAIPIFLIFLICLAFVPARRQLNTILLKFIGASININGVSIPLVPIIACVNFLNVYYCLEKI